MTRDEQRAAIIKAMAIAAYATEYDSESYPWGNQSEYTRETLITAQTAAFDAQHDLARVNPIEATEEMVSAGLRHREISQGWLAETFESMAAAGRLTNKRTLPDIDDIQDENFTGGRRSEDFLERVRRGDLHKPPEKQP